MRQLRKPISTQKKSTQRTLGVWLWDILTSGIVVLPLLTGGIWIRRPGLFLELSDLAVPVLLVSLIWILFLKKSHFLEESWIIQQALRIWKIWQKQTQKRPLLTLSSVALMIGSIWSLASLKRHWVLGSNLSDLGIYVNGIWNSVFGIGYWSSPNGGTYLLADHQSFSFVALGPVFRIFPYAETLLILQGIGLALGGGALYFLSQQYFSKNHWINFALPWVYWAYLPIRNAYFNEFHPDTLMLTTFLWSIVGLQSSRNLSRVLGFLGVLYSVGLKEAGPPVMVAVGIGWLLGAGPEKTRSFTKKMAGPMILLGSLIFYFDYHWVPKLYGEAHYHKNEYSHFGEGILNVILSPLTHPQVFLEHLVSKSRLQFLFWTLAPLGFLPLLNPAALVAALPGYLMLFLSNAEYRVSVGFHYAIIPAIGLFWSLPGAIQAYLSIYPKKLKDRRIALWLLFWALAANGRSDFFRIRDLTVSPFAQWLTHEVIPALNKTSSMAAEPNWVPHMATRPWISGVPNIRDTSGHLVDCILIDGLRESESFLTSLTTLGYHLVLRCENFKAYERRSEPTGTAGCFEKLPLCLVKSNLLNSIDR